MNKKRIQFFFAFLIIIVFVVWSGVFSSASTTDTNLHLYFLNVGQGDSGYIKFPNGQDALIDGGPDNSVLTELGRAMDFGDRKIDLVVLTHPHADHVSGLIEVIKRYEIGEVWHTKVEYSSSAYSEFQNLIKEKGIAEKIVYKDIHKEFGEVKLSVLYPLLEIENKIIDNVNNASIINELNYSQFSALFLGDAEEVVQKKISPSLKTTTVLKVGHHGSKNGTIKELLGAVRPAIAVISSGKNNKYGHPHTETLELLKNFVVQIYRTDQNGTVQVSSNGKNWWVKLEK